MSVVPLSYFMSASATELEGIELKRLNAAANLKKEIDAMTEEYLSLLEVAGVARWLRENREQVLAKVGSHLDGVTEIKRENAA